MFIGRTDVEAETPVFWPPDAKSWLIGKDPDAGKGWGQEEKGPTEDEMVGWHHWLKGHGIGWTLGVGDGQGGLVCWGSWGRKESDTTEQLNWTDNILNSESYHECKVFLPSGPAKHRKTTMQFQILQSQPPVLRSPTQGRHAHRYAHAHSGWVQYYASKVQNCVIISLNSRCFSYSNAMNHGEMKPSQRVKKQGLRRHNIFLP